MGPSAPTMTGDAPPPYSVQINVNQQPPANVHAGPARHTETTQTEKTDEARVKYLHKVIIVAITVFSALCAIIAATFQFDPLREALRQIAMHIHQPVPGEAYGNANDGGVLWLAFGFAFSALLLYAVCQERYRILQVFRVLIIIRLVVETTLLLSLLAVRSVVAFWYLFDTFQGAIVLHSLSYLIASIKSAKRCGHSPGLV